MSLQVFLSWSGARSRGLAQNLYDWLPKVIQAADPWMSEVDIPIGERWNRLVAASLSDHHVGILCLTPENTRAPWLLFEAGALSKAFDHARVCPVLLGLQPEDLAGGPLGQFQVTRLTREEMLRLIKSLNDLQENGRVNERVLLHSFDKNWPDLEAAVRELPTRPVDPAAERKGGEGLRLIRGNASVKRRQQELQENNKYLQAATSVRIVAMTYNSLAAAIPELRFPKLQDAELCVYALPNLLLTHPVLQRTQPGLENEWRTGVGRTIDGLLNEAVCPNLTHLDLTLFSVSPTLTGTDVTLSDETGRRQEKRLRITFIINGSQPENIPTLILSNCGDEGSTEPLFEAFQTMFDNVGKRTPPSLRFVLKRPGYTRGAIETFIRHLRTVSNHPQIGPVDRRFSVAMRLAGAPPASGELDSFAAFRLLRQHREKAPVRVFWKGSQSRLTLAEEENEQGATTRLREMHLFACFLLMTWGDDIVLIDHRKGGWEYDIPGGKVSRLDASERDALVREAFEELGFLLDVQRLSPPLGVAYDPKSAREADEPVIAQYYHYPLNPQEREYLFDVARQTTKGHPLVGFPLKRLLKEKRATNDRIEAVCHAPSRAVERILLLLESTGSTS